MSDYNEIIKQSQENINKLTSKLKEFDDLYNHIVDITTQPKEYNKKLKEVINLVLEVINNIENSVTKYIDETNTFLTEKINDLAENTEDLRKEIFRIENVDFDNSFDELKEKFIEYTGKELSIELKKIDNKTKGLQAVLNGLTISAEDLKSEISRIENIDFDNSFDELKEKFIEYTSKELSIELKKIDNKTKDLQIVLDDLKNEANRFQSIDLDKQFAIHQKTLSEIFNAINSINSILSNITQTLLDISKNTVLLQNNFEKEYDKLKHQIIDIDSKASNNLSVLNNLEKNYQILMQEIKIINSRNLEIKKSNKIITIFHVLEVISLVSLILYILFK